MALTVTHIEDLLSQGADALGLEIVAVEMAGGNRPLLRIYIDGENGVTVDDCARASRQFSAILDVEDPISSRYTLEVSSPGLDRPLAKPDHFEAAIGERVKIKMASLVAGRRRFSGSLESASATAIVVNVDGEPHTLNYAQMDKARLVPDFDFDAALEQSD